MFYKDHAVEKLLFYLLNEEIVNFGEHYNIENFVNRQYIGRTKFIKWMDVNYITKDANHLTYVNFLLEWVWH